MSTSNEIRRKMRFEGENWPLVRASLHIHTDLAGGTFSPEMTREIYGDDNVIALTDTGIHQTLVTPDDYRVTVLPGIEWKVPGPHGTTVTLLAYGLSSDAPVNPQSVEEAIGIAQTAGAAIDVAHPHQSGLHPHDLIEMAGIDGIEIYNANARKNGKAYSLNTWDNMLDWYGPSIAGIATDGFHHPDSFRDGWLMLCARDCSREAVMEALKARRFYATQGPNFTCLEFQNGHFHAEFSSAVEVLLIGNSPHVPEGFNALTVRAEGHPWSGTNPAESLTESGPDFEEATTFIDTDLPRPWWKGATYFRCQIRDKQGRYAWSQAFSIKA